MDLQVDDELLEICAEIVEEARSLEGWREIESDDLIQTLHYVGGFDATEDAFCFSARHPGRDELWFQFTLEEASDIAARKRLCLPARAAD
jgi:hypothetical protein